MTDKEQLEALKAKIRLVQVLREQYFAQLRRQSDPQYHMVSLTRLREAEAELDRLVAEPVPDKSHPLFPEGVP